MPKDVDQTARPKSWLCKLGIVTVAVLLGVSAFLTAILFVSHSPWTAIGTMVASAILGYAAYRFSVPAGDRKFSVTVVLWIITTLAMLLLLSAETWWRAL